MLPSVTISKVSGGSAGAVAPNAIGLNAIIAASSTGTQNVASSFSTQAGMTQALGIGPLVELGAYNTSVSQKPSILIKSAATVAGAYGSINSSITGACVVTAGGSAPLDEYAPVKVVITNGGTVGVSGITYTYSLDGGTTTSGNQNLGTNTTLTIPNSGVSFSLTSASLNTGDSWTCYTTRPQANNSDLIAALEALRVYSAPWENVLIDQDATSTTVNTVDTWLASLESQGGFHGAFLNSRHKTEPVPSAESETTFAAAMATAFNSVSCAESLSIAVGSDAGDLPSLITGIVQPRPVSLALAARCALIPAGEDPAYVARGPVTGFGIADGNGNPKWHNEQLYPNLDDLRLSTFTTQPGLQGVYLTNGNVLSPSGSAFVYTQHFRCMNIACTNAFQQLVQRLGQGVQKKAPDPITGAVYIAEQDAAAIEQQITAALRRALKGQVTDVVFQLSRNDDLSSNSGAIIHGNIEIEALAYLKEFLVNAAFVKAISVPV